MINQVRGYTVLVPLSVLTLPTAPQALLPGYHPYGLSPGYQPRLGIEAYSQDISPVMVLILPVAHPTLATNASDPDPILCGLYPLPSTESVP